MRPADIKKRSAELLELVGLGGLNRKIGGFSRGMKQRLGIAQALLGEPALLICDEPTSALDPVGRKEILDILSVARQRTSIVFSTHILSDVGAHLRRNRDTGGREARFKRQALRSQGHLQER